MSYFKEYKLENRTKGWEDIFETIDECLEEVSEYPDDNYVLYYYNRDGYETELDINEYLDEYLTKE